MPIDPQLIENLKPEQIHWLNVRLESSNDSDALRKTGLSQSTLSYWRQKDNAFRGAQDHIRKLAVTLAMEDAGGSLIAAMRALQEALEAEDRYGNADHKIRMEAAKAILSTHGLLKSKTEISGPDGKALGIGSVNIQFNKLSVGDMEALEGIVTKLIPDGNASHETSDGGNLPLCLTDGACEAEFTELCEASVADS